MPNCHFCGKSTPLMTSKEGESINWYMWNTTLFAFCTFCIKKTLLDIEKLGTYGNAEQRKSYNEIVYKMVNDSTVNFIGDKKQSVLIKVRGV